MRSGASENFEEAAAWALRLEAHPHDPVLAAALEAWLADDPRRRGALLRARAALSLVDDLAGEHPDDRFGVASTPQAAPDRRRMLAGLAAAATAAGVGGLAVLSRWRRIDTGMGEVRKVPLADGSLAAVNTDSQVDVKIGAQARQVRLARGEAWFKVAHDPERPFVVEAGPVRVRAIGTAFCVRRMDNRAQVLVTEGVVEVWMLGHEDRRIRVAAGSWAIVGPDQPAQAVVANREIENALAWRDGQIALYGESLAAAAAEFNRYNARKLIIDDPYLASEKLVGQFSTNDPEGFAAAAAATLGAQVAADETSIHLTR